MTSYTTTFSVSMKKKSFLASMCDVCYINVDCYYMEVLLRGIVLVKSSFIAELGLPGVYS